MRLNQSRSVNRLWLFLFLLWFSTGYCEQSLVFVSAPDLHCIEPFLEKPVSTDFLKKTGLFVFWHGESQACVHAVARGSWGSALVEA